MRALILMTALSLTVLAHAFDFGNFDLEKAVKTVQSINPSDFNLALMFKPHPAFGKRLELLENEMTPALDEYARQPDMQKRFAAVMSGSK